MNKKILLVLSVAVFLPAFLLAQDGESTGNKKRARVVITENITIETPTPTPPTVVIVPSASPTTAPEPRTIPAYRIDTPSTMPETAAQSANSLRYIELQSRIEEAKRQMRTRPLRISMLDEEQTTSIVLIAFYNWNSRSVDYAVMSKELFLDKDVNVLIRTEGEQTVRVSTIRGNGVNTPVMIFDLYNRPQLPLIVQYPIEKYGRFIEMAYYVSTHPGIVTPETVSAGRTYVGNVIDTAREKLRAQGIFIHPKVADIAERLVLVEHVDHSRFRNEYHPRIYNDVFALYALNQGQTYRYSVSSAGAGGMVQMIPATYRMIRSRYYAVGLMPDFVEGMRDHLNATQAMLLYMQMTWNDLAFNSTVREAMDNGFATQEQLMAAGYNSNPSRLPLYIRRGGAGWTSLIPRETIIYLQIFESVERFVPLEARGR